MLLVKDELKAFFRSRTLPAWPDSSAKKAKEGMMSDGLQHQVQSPARRPSVPLTVPLLILLAIWVFALLPKGPWTLQGRFNQLQLGMTQAEVHAIMGRPGSDPPPWQNVPTYALRLTAEKGWVERQEFEAPTWKVYWLDPAFKDPDGGWERWASGDTAVCVQYDAHGLVSEVLWLEERPGRSRWLERLRAFVRF
jgi:hypothetical protein